MMPATAMAEADRLELEAGDAGRDVEPGLALHADRLQRVGIARAADQEIAAAADADRRVGADAAIKRRRARRGRAALVGALTAQVTCVCAVTPRSTPMRRTVAT